MDTHDISSKMMVNGKPLGFTSEDINGIVPEVLESYMPIRPKESQLTGKAMLMPSIGLIDGSAENVLFSNIIVANSREIDEFSRALRIEAVYEFHDVQMKAWNFPEFPELEKANVKALKKVASEVDLDEDHPEVSAFMSALSNGVKGLISITIRNPNPSSCKLSYTLHYADLLRYRASLERSSLVLPKG